MGRSVTAAAGLAALAVLCGCTVQPAEAGGTPGPRVQVDVPPTAPSTPTNSPTSTPPSTPSSAPADDKPSGTTPSPSPTPARVLWQPGDKGRDIRELQARLRQIAWLYHGPTGEYDDLTEQAVRGFQGKRGLPKTGKTDTVTWERLLKMTHEPGRWELYLMGGQEAAPPDSRCLTGRVLCIDKTSRTLRWMVDGRTLSTVAVRFGSQYTPTREGVFQVYWKSRHHVSTLYDTPMPYAMFFSGGQAVHYSADFAATGYAGASHGCVNVRDRAAIAKLFDRVRTGDKVVVSW